MPEGTSGARVDFHDDGVVLVKQTVMRNGQYRIEGQKERHVDPGDDVTLGRVSDWQGRECFKGRAEYPSFRSLAGQGSPKATAQRLWPRSAGPAPRLNARGRRVSAGRSKQAPLHG